MHAKKKPPKDINVICFIYGDFGSRVSSDDTQRLIDRTTADLNHNHVKYVCMCMHIYIERDGNIYIEREIYITTHVFIHIYIDRER